MTMVRPDDLDKLLDGKMPSWVTKPEKEEVQKVQQEPIDALLEELLEKKVASQEVVRFEAVVGKYRGVRMYAFIPDALSQDGPTMDGVTHLSRALGARSRPYDLQENNMRSWKVLGGLPHGTIVKLFLSTGMGQSPYGTHFFMIDKNAPETTAAHPTFPELYLKSHMTKIDPQDYQQHLIPRQPVRSNAVTPQITITT